VEEEVVEEEIWTATAITRREVVVVMTVAIVADLGTVAIVVTVAV